MMLLLLYQQGILLRRFEHSVSGREGQGIKKQRIRILVAQNMNVSIEYQKRDGAVLTNTQPTNL
jgi:hypothetical protein